jgi:hypothetical protein
MRFFIYFLAIGLAFSLLSCEQDYKTIAVDSIPLELTVQSDNWQKTPVSTFLEKQTAQTIPTAFRISKADVLSILSVNPAQRVNFRLGLDEQNQMLLSTVGQRGILNAEAIFEFNHSNNWTEALQNQDWSQVETALHHEGEQLRSFSIEKSLLKDYAKEAAFTHIDLQFDINAEGLLSLAFIAKAAKGQTIEHISTAYAHPCPIHCGGDGGVHP